MKLKKVNWLYMCFYMNPYYPPMYILQTRHKHLGCFHKLMFCLKLTRELVVFFSKVAVAIIVVFSML